MISKRIQQALWVRFPKGDFRNYFEFLATRPSLTKGVIGTEVHHIIPKSVLRRYHQREFDLPILDPENCIVLTVEDHNRAHRLLGEAESWLLRTGRRALGFYD